MARTTPELVGAIIEVDGAIDLAPFIAAASSLVDQVASSYDDATLLLIETWLSAAFYCTRDPRPETERAGSVMTKYQSSVEVGIYNSQYGQMALTFDVKGVLRALIFGKRRTVSASWLGKTKQEVILERGASPLDAADGALENISEP